MLLRWKKKDTKNLKSDTANWIWNRDHVLYMKVGPGMYIFNNVVDIIYTM